VTLGPLGLYLAPHSVACVRSRGVHASAAWAARGRSLVSAGYRYERNVRIYIYQARAPRPRILGAQSTAAGINFFRATPERFLALTIPPRAFLAGFLSKAAAKDAALLEVKKRDYPPITPSTPSQSYLGYLDNYSSLSLVPERSPYPDLRLDFGPHTIRFARF
jgi:hypothetical protein